MISESLQKMSLDALSEKHTKILPSNPTFGYMNPFSRRATNKALHSWPTESTTAKDLCSNSLKQTLIMMDQDLDSVELLLRPAESFDLRQWGLSRT